VKLHKAINIIIWLLSLFTFFLYSFDRIDMTTFVVIYIVIIIIMIYTDIRYKKRSE